MATQQTPQRGSLPTWFQAGGAIAAVIVTLAIVGAAGLIAWGSLTSDVSTDHDLIVAISDDIDEIKLELRQQRDAQVQSAHAAELDRAELRSRIHYLEQQMLVLGGPHADQRNP